MSEQSTVESSAGENLGTRIARLSAGQLDCLKLVDRHMSSKEIAAELGVSPHTVDQRLRVALQILGVDRRAQAARLVSEHLAGPPPANGAPNTNSVPHHAHDAVPMPFPTASHPRNRYPAATKLLLVLLIALFAAFSIGLYLAGLDTTRKYLDPVPVRDHKSGL